MPTYLKLPQYIEKIEESLARHFNRRFEGCDISACDIELEKTPDPKLGEFALPCFSFAKKLKNSPVKIASELVEGFRKSKYILGIQAVGPYVNVRVQPGEFIRSVCMSVHDQGDSFGASHYGKGKKVMIEYSSPNSNKPLHIGHVRTNLIGMAVANVLEFSGYRVIKANLVNDRGIHICKSMLAYRKYGEGKTPESTGIKGDHFVGDYYVLFENSLKEERELYAKKQQVNLEEFSRKYIKEMKERIRACKDKQQKKELKKQLRALGEKNEKFEQKFLENSVLYQEALKMLAAWERGDPKVHELWKRMRDWVLKGFDETYRALGCEFDKLYFESETYTLGREFVERGLAAGNFYRKEDGSVWVSADKLKKNSPTVFKGEPLKDKLLLRGDGTSVYITQDIGTAVLKYKDFGLDDSIYVVAEEQNLHFKILFSVLKTLGFSWAKNCRHLAYGMVTLPRGMGRLKSREGTAVDADDLIAEMTERARQKIEKGDVHVPLDQVEETAKNVALAALKIFILQISLEKNIQFDPEKTIDFRGDTGPAIQYSHARICSMLRRAKKEPGFHFDMEANIDYELLNTHEEFALVRELCNFPGVVLSAAKSYQVSLIANYLLSLTKVYAKTYQRYRVLDAKTKELRNARLALANATEQVLKNGMRLLGTVVPESM